MDLRETERIGGAPRRSRFDATYLVMLLALLVLGGVAFFGWNTDTIRDVRVAIDGVAGTFALDTGASFVTVTPDFARRAHLAGAGGARLRAMTANGAVYSELATAAIVKVGRVEARQVPVAILDKGMGPLDGLLGRSFLSRFDVTIGATRWSLKPKATAGR